MAVYNITNPKSALHSVEFTPVSDGNFSFFYVKDQNHSEAVKEWVTKDLGQEIIATTNVEGRTVVISHGEKTKKDMLAALKEHGDTPELKVQSQPLNFWAIRGGMSVVGQTLQLASATLGVEKVTKKSPQLNPSHAKFTPGLKEGQYVRKSFSPDIGAFAILNLTANAINMIYGGQKEEATNQLQAIKSDINANLNDHVTTSERTFDINETHAHRHKDQELEKAKGVMGKVNDTLAEHSVRIGEIGLRYLGALALVFPYNKWKDSFKLAKTDGMKAGFKNSLNGNKGLLYAGLGYLAGKTIALFAKVPDPYDDKPKTTLDTIREDYLFKIGGLIEAVAGGSVGYNAFKTKRIGLSDSDKPHIDKTYRDWLGTVGGSLFAGGYVVRYWAPFGSKHLDTEEVFAHATDTLAKTPPEKLPQLMAESAATIKNHLSDKPIEFGEVFTKMMTDLYRYHHIALDNLGTEPEERRELFSKRLQRKDPAPDKAVVGKPTIERKSLRPEDIAASPTATHAERSKTPEAAGHGLAV